MTLYTYSFGILNSFVSEYTCFCLYYDLLAHAYIFLLFGLGTQTCLLPCEDFFFSLAKSSSSFSFFEVILCLLGSLKISQRLEFEFIFSVQDFDSFKQIRFFMLVDYQKTKKVFYAVGSLKDYCSQLKAMKCFQFVIGEKKDEAKTTKSNSTPLPSSTFVSHEVRQSGSEFNSQNASDTSNESRGRNQFPSLSERPNNLKVFTFTELKISTKNFSRSMKLGEGGFGCVFRGAIKNYDDSSQKLDVAIKQLGRRGLQGHKEWVTEVNVLGVVEHPNLVKLIGYCAEDDERGIQRLLIYEYMPNRSVEDHLSAKSEAPLSWAMRLKIAQDAARGLAYLHEEMDFQIIFRDFKSSNILLDEQWNAKLSDFGLARLGPSDGLTHVSTAVVGTMGYAAPEYIQTGRLTSKSDVWSYGVFLYELITGRRPLDRNRPRSEQKLLEWVKPYLSDAKKFQQILDPRLEKKQIMKSAHKLSLVANRCLSRHSKTRPKMSEVLEMINKVIEASVGIGSPQPPILTSDQKPSSEETRKRGKRRLVDVMVGDGAWLVRMWSSKLVKTC